MRTVFSIGLNIGQSEPGDQLRDTLRACCEFLPPFDMRMGASTWHGVPERFVQVRVNAPARNAQYLARALSQDAIAIWQAGCTHWTLVDRDGNSTAGASITEFPILFAQSAPAAARADMPHDHSGIQAHSMGEYFPAVIARLEQGGELYGWELTIGAFRELYATREDAEMVASWTCAGGRIIPERYAQLVPGAGKSMAAWGRA